MCVHIILVVIPQDQCYMLWCQLPGKGCLTNQMSVADGTPCTVTDGGATGVSH